MQISLDEAPNLNIVNTILYTYIIHKGICALIEYDNKSYFFVYFNKYIISEYF